MEKEIATDAFRLKVATIVPLKLRKGKRIYRIVFDNGASVRLDITDGPRPWWGRQKACHEQGVPVAKELCVVERKGDFYRFTEFIEGERLYDVWHLDSTFIAGGRIAGKINTIREGALYLTNSDFNEFNFIRSPDGKIHMVDADGLLAVQEHEIDTNMIRLIRHNAKLCDRAIKCFLKGYAAYRNPDGIYRKLYGGKL